MKSVLSRTAAAAALMAVFPQSALAGGFYIQEQSVSGLGTAYAGAAADMPDASTIYYNPAGMTDLERGELSVGTHILHPRADFKNTGSTVRSTAGTGGATVALGGGDGGNPFGWAAVPNAYLAVPLRADRRVWGGIGISAPFGLTNKYESDFFGRYDSTQNQLITVNVAPSIAYAVTDRVSIGAGIDVQHADAKLENALPSPVTAGGPSVTTDGLADMSGSDITAGLNAGIIVKPAQGVRAGLHYRQGISHTLEGRLVTRAPADLPGVGGSVSRLRGEAELDLPNIVSAGVSVQANEKLKLLFGATWSEWSNFNDIPIGFSDGTSSQSVQNYRNTWAVSAGAHYRLDDRWLLKAGAQFDQTPTVDGFRSTRIPDGDRTWIAAGATYDVSEDIALELGAVYVDVAEEPIDLTHTVSAGAASSTYTLDAKTGGSVGIFSAALRYRFDTPY